MSPGAHKLECPLFGDRCGAVPGMIGSRFVSFALVEKGTIDLFSGDDLCLPFLFVKDGVFQRSVFVKDGDFSLSILTDHDLGIVKCIGWAIGVDLVDDIFKLDGQALGNGAGFLPSKDALQELMGCQGAMGIQRAAWLDGEAGVEIGYKLGQVGIALLHVVDTPQAHLLDQTVLQGLVGPLYPALGLGRIGT